MGRSNFDQGLGWGGGDIQPDKNQLQEWGKEESTSPVVNAKNWGTLSPMPMTKLAIMCNMKLRLFWDKGRDRDTIMNILCSVTDNKMSTKDKDLSKIPVLSEKFTYQRS